MIKSHAKFVGLVLVFTVPFLLVMSFHISRLQITPNDQFFLLQIGEIPQIDKNAWRLEISGNVNNSLTLDYEDITQMDSKEILATLECVEGPTGTAIWEGVSLKDILELAGVKESAYDVIFYAGDGYTDSLNLEVILKEEIILAYKMNGEELPVEQGFPLRIVSPNHYGYKWVKWIVRIEVVDYDYIGFWEQRGWSDEAMRSNFTSWITHAYLFSLGFIFAGLSYVSGKKLNPGITYSFYWLPRFVNKKFHVISSIIFSILAVASFGYWAFATFQLRGAVFYSVHGIVGLINTIAILVATISGLSRFYSTLRGQNVHVKSTKWAFYLYLISILLGFGIALLGTLRLNQILIF